MVSKALLPSEYYGVLHRNMTIPRALFLSEEEAAQWAAGYKDVEVRKYLASDAFLEVLRQC